MTNNTIKTTIALQYSCKVNEILYFIKQLPILKKVLTNKIYDIQSFKILATLIGIVTGIVAPIIKKILYFTVFMVVPINVLDLGWTNQNILHIFLMLTIIGGLINTDMFSSTKEDYYAIFLLKINPKQYTLYNYVLSLVILVFSMGLVVIIGSFIIKFKFLYVILCLAYIVSVKNITSAINLLSFKRGKKIKKKNDNSVVLLILSIVILALVYLSLKFNYKIPEFISVGIMLLAVVLNFSAIVIIGRFSDYRRVYITLKDYFINSNSLNPTEIIREATVNQIEFHEVKGSKKTGFAYLNELFIKRHKKILYGAIKKIVIGILGLTVVSIFALILFPHFKPKVNEIILSHLSMFLFVMYTINRGTGFTRALFINCDNSLLKYGFYRKPENILNLFKIRLIEIIKVNAVPAVALGVSTDVIVFMTGGHGNPLTYILIISILLALSAFFSIHYLVLYYLLQPYTLSTQIKSPAYSFIMALTYLPCYILMDEKMNLYVFSLWTLGFTIIYSLIANVLVYKLAPKTFKIRN